MLVVESHGYRPHLDGIRALAILMVLEVHWFTATVPGWLGVDVFFVLSGYLITSLLLRTPQGLGRFYLRRVARLYPAMLTMIVGVTALSLFGGTHTPYRYALAAGSYVGNYYQVNHGHIGPLSHTWSLAVEEQFYLIWPPVLFVLLRWSGRRAATLAAGGGALLSSVWLVMHFYGPVWEYWGYRTEVRGGGLLVGCTLALLAPAASRWIGRAGLVVIAGVLLAGYLAPGYDTKFYVAAVTLSTAAIIAAPPQFLAWQPLVTLGKLSYSFYLWHYPMLFYTYGRPLPVRLAALAAAGVLAVASYRLVENPVRRWANGLIERRWLPAVMPVPVHSNA